MTRLLIALLILVAPQQALLAARPKDKQPASPEVFTNLTRCRAIAEDAARLACFDKAAEALETATQKREVMMIDRQQAEENKRTLFGFTLPNVSKMFGGSGEEEEELKRIEDEIASARQDGDSRWILRMKSGSTWRQIDGNTLAIAPRTGTKVVINRAALGSYMMRVGGQPGIRARREN